jgi:hypothetical protein
MTLFDILSNNERIIVWSTREDGCIYTWNQSSTFQCWQVSYQRETWDEVGIMVKDGATNIDQVRVMAREWSLFWDAEEVAREIILNSQGE